MTPTRQHFSIPAIDTSPRGGRGWQQRVLPLAYGEAWIQHVAKPNSHPIPAVMLGATPSAIAGMLGQFAFLLPVPWRSAGRGDKSLHRSLILWLCVGQAHVMPHVLTGDGTGDPAFFLLFGFTGDPHCSFLLFSGAWHQFTVST